MKHRAHIHVTLDTCAGIRVVSTSGDNWRTANMNSYFPVPHLFLSCLPCCPRCSTNTHTLRVLCPHFSAGTSKTLPLLLRQRRQSRPPNFSIAFRIAIDRIRQCHHSDVAPSTLLSAVVCHLSADMVERVWHISSIICQLKSNWEHSWSSFVSFLLIRQKSHHNCFLVLSTRMELHRVGGIANTKRDLSQFYCGWINAKRPVRFECPSIRSGLARNCDPRSEVSRSISHFPSPAFWRFSFRASLCTDAPS